MKSLRTSVCAETQSKPALNQSSAVFDGFFRAGRRLGAE
jgi:hypothetical protein